MKCGVLDVLSGNSNCLLSDEEVHDLFPSFIAQLTFSEVGLLSAAQNYNFTLFSAAYRSNCFH